ncbi:unnamed protein product [Chondrus crispus]|uniref:Uncharacterized protein n=1 Tax=Chondrus crispus TaxID=2769 RepID=R7QSC9_CHOCR|nr:unnamed protein product [Chondrus crispus]CDF41004.1 unnamed protein product [Chondrus crispus]|eukprot:XP_005711298.1 unnamed protein product [Chondrus crispus]
MFKLIAILVLLISLATAEDGGGYKDLLAKEWPETENSGRQAGRVPCRCLADRITIGFSTSNEAAARLFAASSCVSSSSCPSNFHCSNCPTRNVLCVKITVYGGRIWVCRADCIQAKKSCRRIPR